MMGNRRARATDLAQPPILSPVADRALVQSSRFIMATQSTSRGDFPLLWRRGFGGGTTRDFGNRPSAESTT